MPTNERLVALKVKRIVGATYVSADQTAIFAKYLEDAGFSVLGFESFDVAFYNAVDVPSADIAAFIKGAVAKRRGVDGIAGRQTAEDYRLHARTLANTAIQ